jgi:hypothetical protein
MMIPLVEYFILQYLLYYTTYSTVVLSTLYVESCSVDA